MLTIFVRRVLPMLLLGMLGLSSCVVRPYGYGPPPPPRYRHGYGRPYGPPPPSPPPGPYRRGY